MLPIEIFQFLMVRLKGEVSKSCRKSTKISIPYGAIKSFIVKVPTNSLSISIPYGAIKS